MVSFVVKAQLHVEILDWISRDFGFGLKAAANGFQWDLRSCIGGVSVYLSLSMLVSSAKWSSQAAISSIVENKGICILQGVNLDQTKKHREKVKQGEQSHLESLWLLITKNKNAVDLPIIFMNTILVTFIATWAFIGKSQCHHHPIYEW